MRLFFEELLIGFEFKNFLIALAVLFIIYLAWESTYVRDYRIQPNAVLIIENNRRLLVDIGGAGNTHRDLRSGTDWTLEAVEPDTNTNDQPPGASEANVTDGNNSTAGVLTSGSNTVQIPEPPPSLEVVIEEVHDLANVRQQLNENAYRTLESFEEGISGLLDDNDGGPQRVIQAMDTAEGIRRRRLAFYSQERDSSQLNATSPTAGSSPSQEGGDATDFRADNCSNENNENKNKSKTDEAAEKDASAKTVNPDSQAEPVEKKDEFRIKLKYLNDDMKLVTGTPNENIGDFKKRNFTLELGAQKFVRLVFNGHVLQPDSKTLQACGLFDNCVVHCLVHNRNPNAANQNQQRTHQSRLGPDNVSTQNTSSVGANPPSNDGPAVGNFSNHESTSSHMMAMYAGMAFIALSLILCWYCRIHYYALFSWYSTLVLILITILFSILGPILIFIENNEMQQAT